MNQLPQITEEQIAEIVKKYRESFANKFANPYVFSIIGLIYAYRGKISNLERLLMGTAAGITLIMLIRKQKESEPQKIALALYKDYESNLLKTVTT